MNEKSFKKFMDNYDKNTYIKYFKNNESLENAIKESMRKRALKILSININFTAIFNGIVRSEKDKLFKDADYDFYCQNFGKVCVLLDEIISILEEIIVRVNKK